MAAARDVIGPDAHQPSSLRDRRKVEPFPGVVDGDDRLVRTPWTAAVPVEFQVFPSPPCSLLGASAHELAPFLAFVRRCVSFEEPSVERVALQWLVRYPQLVCMAFCQQLSFS